MIFVLTKRFEIWSKCALIRAIKTVAQTAVATIGTSLAIEEVNWLLVLSSSLLAGILSILTSLAGLPEVEAKELEEAREINGQNQ